MKAIVGYTGFVGSNIYEKGDFDCAYNSKNIEQAYGSRPDLMVYAGLRAEKYLANNDPEKDMEQIRLAQENIRKISPKQLVLISTVDVFKNPLGVDENTPVDTENLHAYGLNRFKLECWVRENYPDALIVRLPALFGKNIKKNFIYDYINVIPFMLKPEKAEELKVTNYYELQSNGFYRLKDDAPKEELKLYFKKAGFTALNFTHSGSRFQFYPLSRLWDDIQTALSHGIRLQHMATEPIFAGELYEYLSGEPFVNELAGKPANYDFRTVNNAVYGGEKGYILDKKTVAEAISAFVLEESSL